jgi:hypothetical protein
MPWIHMGEWRYSSTFLTSVLDEGKWSVSRPCHLASEKRAADAHWTGGWVGPRIDLDTCSGVQITRLHVSPLQLLPPSVQIVSSAPSSEKPSNYALPLTWEVRHKGKITVVYIWIFASLDTTSILITSLQHFTHFKRSSHLPFSWKFTRTKRAGMAQSV